MFVELVIIAATISVCATIFYYQKNRKFLAMAEKIPSPKQLPILGHVHHFMFKSSSEIMTTFTQMILDYDYKPFKLWLGSELMIYISDPVDIQKILTDTKSLANANVVNEFTFPITGPGLFAAPMDVWTRHRKIIAPTFNKRIITSYMPIVKEEIEKLLHVLSTDVAGKGFINVYPHFYGCLSAILMRTLMGQQSNDKHSKVIEWLNTYLQIQTQRVYNPWLKSNLIFKLTKYAQIEKECIEGVRGVADSLIREKRKNFQKSHQPKGDYLEGLKRIKSFLDRLVEMEDENMMTDEEIRAEVISHVLAGTDTTSTVAAGTLMMLGMHPEIQQRMYEEIIEADQDERDFTTLEYTDRVVKEGLRLFPGGAVITRNPGQDIKLDDCTIPANSSVIISVVNVHRNPNYWPDPFTFDPDRFLPEEQQRRHHFAYLPFSAGQRNCIGNTYGLVLLKTVLVSVLKKFKVSTPYRKVEDIKLTAEVVLKASDGHLLSLEPRDK